MRKSMIGSGRPTTRFGNLQDDYQQTDSREPDEFETDEFKDNEGLEYYDKHGAGDTDKEEVNSHSSYSPRLVRKNPVAQANSTPTKPDQPAAGPDTRIKFSARINRDLHARLKIHSFKTHTNVSELIEGWIEENCPDI